MAKIHTTPANVGESPRFGTIIKMGKAQRILTDKAYASKANCTALKGKHRNDVLHKAVHGRSLGQSQKYFNKLIYKQLFHVEQCLGTMKLLCGLY